MSCQHSQVHETDRFVVAGLAALIYQCGQCLREAMLYRLPDEKPTQAEILAEFVRPPRRVADGVRC
ncbi:hypothetical protein [Micromonospora sp. NPDC048169]|uniref:hypothetical protein n=1 Tax=Micromonospora sp. NPDC048169 TaxID=3154711 RepID=UPI0033F9F83E